MRSLKTSGLSWVLAFVLYGVCQSVQAQQVDDCPCGSDQLPPFIQAFIPQEFHGADFRPACRQHDACYYVPGANRRMCDIQFRDGMYCACNCSKYPLLCRIKATEMFIAVRLFGRGAYRQAQCGY